MSISGITTRELEILRLIATGMRNQEIADQLVISLSTVKRHIANTYGKLGVDHRTEAVAQLTTRVCSGRSIKPNYTLEVHPDLHPSAEGGTCANPQRCCWRAARGRGQRREIAKHE